LVTFVDVVTFFGVASLFAWLTYGPLQRDLLEDFGGINIVRAKRNFYTVNDYFLVSFLFYSADIVGEYTLHTSRLYWIGFNPMYQMGFLRLVIMACFFGGLLTLCVPVWYLRSVQKGDRSLDQDLLPDFAFTLYVSSVTVIGLALDFEGFMATYFRWWSPAAWALAEVAEVVGFPLVILAYVYERRRLKFIAALLNLTPIIMYIVVWRLGYL
jgi:hypothetical protein